MNIIKKCLSLLLVLVMVLGLLPAAVAATEEENCVYISISYDGKYIDDVNGNAIAYYPISMDAIAAVDLTEYGLDNMLFDGDGDGNYDTTALQLLIYAHEVLYGGDWSEVTFDALPGSSYFSDGIFGFTENLVYFLNGDFPVDESMSSDYMTVGATSDRIVLEAGDFLDVASFECYSFLWDQEGGFHLFADEDGNYVHDYYAEKDEPLTVKLMHSFCDLMYGAAWVYDATDYEVYYGSVFGEAEGSVTTDDSGCAEITFDEAGVYYVWCDGGLGTDDGWTHTSCDHYNAYFEPCVVSAPAYAKVTIAGDETAETTVPIEATEATESTEATEVPDETQSPEVPEETIPSEVPETPRQAQDVTSVLKDTMAQLATTVKEPAFGTNAGEWTVFSLARGNHFTKNDKYFTDYYDRIVETVKAEASKVNMNGALHKSKSTENSRLIVAMSAIGKHATSVGGWDLVEAYSANGLNWIKKQGLNGTIWALIALDSGNYTTSDPTIRQQCVDAIISTQHDDGGWSLITNKTLTSNVDITCMALTALYPYRTQSTVAAACEEAIAWLSAAQLDNGGFPYGEGETSESCAWAIVALTTWGINPDTDSRFIKNGKSPVDNMLSYYLEDEKMFAHQGSSSNDMATDQACYALVAYDRFINGKTNLYDYSDVTFDGKIETPANDKNAYTGKLNISTTELVNKLLTAEEKKLVENGADVRVDLSVKDISNTVRAEDKSLIEKALDKNTVGLYLDITLSKQLGNTEAVKVTNTNGAVTVTITVPQTLRNTNTNINRTYKVIRIHEGKADILDAIFNAETGELSFKTDAFSTYALVYSDTAVTTTNPDVPKTGDNTPLSLYAALMVISIIALTTMYTGNKKKYAK